MTGVEVCQRIKDGEQTRDIPIILVTASHMRDLEERCRIFGADSCLVKPYQPAELLEKINEILPPDAASL
jgi:CheY-like chemotaxis protein